MNVIARAGATSIDRDTLFKEAVELRMRGRIPEALTTLSRLKSLHPGFSRAYQELGHCHALLRNTAVAIEALREAVHLNPTLPASWAMLEQLYRMVGDCAQSTAAAHHLAVLEQLPREVVAANSLFVDGDVSAAEQVIRPYVEKDGGNVGALRLLARICIELGSTTEARSLLELILERDPDYHDARLDYALLLLGLQQYVEALNEAERLLRHDPENREYVKQYAAACIGLGDYESLREIYQKLLASQSASASEVADLRLWHANALKITGRGPEAIAEYHASLAARPDYAVSWFALSNLKTYRFSDDEIARMSAAESRPAIEEMERVYLCFALGKALEDRGSYPASWQYYDRGNALRHRSSRYRPECAEAAALELRRVFTAKFFSIRQGWGNSSAAPIFIVGLPRSGSTLIEQILASHPQVEGTQELNEIGRYAAELCGTDPHCDLPQDARAFEHLSALDVRELGERFLCETRVYRRLGRTFFIDKMPSNFWHIGLIQLMLPRSTIIDVRRAPMACGFGNFKQLFGGPNNEFSYSLDHIGRHYRTYLDLMRHWSKVLPGRVLRVQYEDVVEDFEGSLGRILEHCGLPFEPACINFHDTWRSVRTPSSEQVRRPIGREGLDRWRCFDPWLGPLRDALGDAVAGYRN